MSGGPLVWKRLTLRQRRIALMVGGTLALLASDAILLRPLRTRVAQLHRQVRETERRLLEATVASNQADAVNRAFEAYQPYAQPAGDAQSELGVVYAEIQSTVRDLGMPLINLKQGEVREDRKNIVTVTLECEATPTQLAQFLDRVQRSAHLLKVTDLNVRVQEGKALRVSVVVSKLLLSAA